MSERIYSRIAGTGSYLPEKVVTNDDLAKVVDTSDEWIRTRTGIRERRVAAEGQTTSDMAYQAALKAIEAAGIAAEEIDLIVVGTTTPDVIFPSTACLVQQKLGIAGCPAFDVNAACSGFVFALSVPGLEEPLRLTGKVIWTTEVSDATKANPAGMGIEFQYQSEEERREKEAKVERLLSRELGEHLASKLLGRKPHD